MKKPQFTNRNVSQAVLHSIGERRLGVEAENATSVEIRRAGVRKIARDLAIGAACVVSAIGMEHLADYAFNHSPTVVYQRALAAHAQPPNGGAEPVTAGYTTP